MRVASHSTKHSKIHAPWNQIKVTKALQNAIKNKSGENLLLSFCEQIENMHFSDCCTVKPNNLAKRFVKKN